MAKTTVALEITANGQQAESSVKSLKQQLREAQNDVQVLSEKFGASSQAAIEAARRAAQLKDAIGDAKALVDAFNPDRKFQAFSSAISGVVGGFSALQGAQALFGVESKDLEKTLLKVQAAMALSQGINSVLEARDAFKILKIVVVDAMRGIRTAIGSTGIGLLAVAIGAIVMAMKDWYDSTQNQVSAEELLKQKEEALRNEIKKTNDEIENRGRINNYLSQVEITNAKARGASIEELRKIEDKFFTEEAYKRQTAFEREISNFAEIEKSYSKDSQIYKDALAQKDKIANDYYTFNQQRNQALANRQLEDYNTDVAKNKEKVDKINADNKRIADANRAQNDLQKKLQDEITLSLIANERDRAATKLEMDLENAKRDIERSDATTKEKNESIALLERQYMVNLSAMKDTWAEEDKQKQLQKQKETDDAIIEARLAAITDENFKKQALIDINRQAEIDKQAEAYNNQLITLEQYNAAVNGINFKYDKQLTDNAAIEAENRRKIAEAEKTAKLEFYDAIGAGFGALSNLFEKGTAASKAFALAEIAIGTGTGFIKGLDIAQNSAKGTGPAAAFAFPIFYASQIAAVLGAASRAKSILQTVKGPGGGQPSLSTPNISAPLSPQAQTTSLNQGQINQLASATTRAFVLESDVSGNQERIRRINRAARIN